MNKVKLSAKIARWALLIEEFDVIVGLPLEWDMFIFLAVIQLWRLVVERVS